jgi:hypothetical protein
MGDLAEIADFGLDARQAMSTTRAARFGID